MTRRPWRDFEGKAEIGVAIGDRRRRDPIDMLALWFLIPRRRGVALD